VLVEGGRIASVDAPATATADEVVDATGLHLMPGVIDPHVHFREPGLTHKEDLARASMACAKGGVTTFFEMPNTVPAAVTRAGVAAKYELASRSSVVNYGFYIAATPNNLEELAGAEGVPGIKIFIGSSTGDLLVDQTEDLERIFAGTTLPVCAHCEDEALVRANEARLNGGSRVEDHSLIRDEAAAVSETTRSTTLAKAHGKRFHVLHVSTVAEVPILADHQNLITGEACVHHLVFNTDDYAKLGTRVQMNPALKTKVDNDGLWAALRDGGLQMVTTDHAPHTLEEKALGYPKSPSGMPSIENSLAVMLDSVYAGRCTLEQVVQWMCEAPARVWDIVDKGYIREGYDADLVLIDLNREHVVRDEDQVTKCRWSPWHGRTLRGQAVRTWVGGRTVYRDGMIDPTVRGTAATFDHARGGFWATA
jgi:dihydroorotase